ncbi:MAG: hypothetical protein WDM81_11560 [Rhizomicrobium sp.]
MKIASHTSMRQMARVPFGYNPLRRVRDDKIPLAVSGFIETLRKLWPDAWGVRMEHVLRNTLYALLEQDDARLPDILKLYSNETYRKAIARKIRNETVRRFWRYEFEQYHYRQKADAVAPIQNKLGALLSDPTLYRILVEPKVDLRFRSMMDEGKVLLVNVSKGRLGADSPSCSARSSSPRSPSPRSPALIATSAAPSSYTWTSPVLHHPHARHDAPGASQVRRWDDARQPAPPPARSGHPLGGARECRHAHIVQVGAEDAPYLAREFQPTFDVEDLLNLPNHSIYLKLMIDGVPDRAFSAATSAHYQLKTTPSPVIAVAGFENGWECEGRYAIPISRR